MSYESELAIQVAAEARRTQRDNPLADLRERLVAADREIADLMAPRGIDPLEYRRLHGKAEGVRLALSYVDEMLRAEAQS